MASIRFLPMPRFRAFDSNGDPLGGGKVYVYAAGTSTKITTWQDANKSSANTNPVILDSEGYADIWFDQNAKLVLDDSNDVQQWSKDEIAPITSQDVTGKFNIVDNGSFENDGDGDGEPDNWTVTLFNSSTSSGAIDTGQVADGVQSLKFTSQGDGGGTAVSDTFAVPAGANIAISFFIRSSVADVRNIVDIQYFDKDGSAVSTSTLYDEDTSNPTSFTQQFFTEVVPGTATQASVKLVGCDSTDSTSGSTWYDFVQVTTQSYIFSGAAGEVTTSADDLSNGIIPGLVQMYAGSSEPTGWLFCSGQAVSRTTYSALFNVVGTTYGSGDGSTTFNVPDLRDRSPLGENTMGASDAARVGTTTTALGDSGGADQHTLTTSEMPSHNHGGGNHNHTQQSAGATSVGEVGVTGSDISNNQNAENTANSGTIITTEGGDSPHNNMHPFLALNFIIKT